MVGRQSIPDIHIGRVYDPRDPECDVHYETFGRLADFFGRSTPAHRHYCFFQVHVLLSGSIRMTLDDHVHSAAAPVVIFTPPAIPHALYSEEGTDGHVLTLRQEVVRQWVKAMPGQWPDNLLREPVFLPLGEATAPGPEDLSGLTALVALIGREFFAERKGRRAQLLALGQAFFIHLARLLAARGPDLPMRPERSEDLRLFLTFCDMVEAHFRDHLTLSEYAKRLSVTEGRLNDICRRMVNLSSKEVVHDRLAQEARRLLRFSAMPVSEICYQLGFGDPAYFSRFFTKRAGMPPSQFRLAEQGRGVQPPLAVGVIT